MSRFLLTDCNQCGEPQIILELCEFCFDGTCEHCSQNVWKQCPECERQGCPEHFDGMYCHECVKETAESK